MTPRKRAAFIVTLPKEDRKGEIDKCQEWMIPIIKAYIENYEAREAFRQRTACD